MKLQKLVYYSQAYSLVATGEELFSEDFQAWVNGPVCPELFNAHRSKYVIGPGELLPSDSSSALSSAQKGLIDHVVSVFKDYNGQQLSELTHAEDPWKYARGNCAPSDKCRSVITKDAIRRYYGQKVTLGI